MLIGDVPLCFQGQMRVIDVDRGCPGGFRERREL